MRYIFVAFEISCSWIIFFRDLRICMRTPPSPCGVGMRDVKGWKWRRRRKRTAAAAQSVPSLLLASVAAAPPSPLHLPPGQDDDFKCGLKKRVCEK